MKKIIFPTILFCFCILGLHAEPFSGTYHSDGMVFYLIHQGGPLKLDARIFRTSPEERGKPVLKTAPSAFLALYNPEERLVRKLYWRSSHGKTETKFDIALPDAPPGVWQLRSSFATNCNLALTLKTEPELKYGVLLSRCRMLPEDLANFSSAWFLVPPRKTPPRLHMANRGSQTEFYDKDGRKIAFDDIHRIVGAKPDFYGNANRELPQGATEIQRDTRGVTVTLRDQSGKLLLQLPPDAAAKQELQPGTLCRIEITPPASPHGSLTLDGFPVILCPDEATARAINGSVERGVDGNDYAHKFQLRMLDWMRSLRAADLAIEPVPVETYRKQWLADPANAALLPVFTRAGQLFRAQNTDCGKPDELGKAPIRLEELALLASLDRPFNPYKGNKALLNRTMLHFFRHMLPLSESGAMFDDPEHAAYCGGTEWTGWESMALYEDYMALAMLAPYNDPELTRLWADALSYQIHRMWSTRLTCENQSLHWPLKLYALAMATGDDIYRAMANDYLKDFADPSLSRSMATGYPMEAYGLDGTYTGISTSLLAFAMRFGNDRTALPVLRRILNLMNHTVVREPDGSLSAANGFAHRTTGSWLNRQYDGGTPLLTDLLPEAAVLHPTSPLLSSEEFAKRFDTLAAAQKMPEDLPQWCRKDGEVLTRYALNSWINYWPQSVFKVGNAFPDAKLPAESEEPFERNFNGEILARRTPSYYAFFYTGNASWRRHNWRYEDSPFPEKSGFTADGNIHSAQPSRAWMAMQGANIFWTPSFGAFLLARNWTMYSQNLIRAERDGAVVDFPVCWSSRHSTDPDRGSMTLEHQSKFLALAFRRTFTMRDDRLHVALSVTAAEPIAPVRLIEQIPFLVKHGLTLEAWNGKAWQALPATAATRVRAALPSGAAIVLEFSAPAEVRRGPDSSSVNDSKLRTGLLDIVFDPDFDGTGEAGFSYTMKADDLK